MTRTLIYYFAFPHYRAQILEELHQRVGPNLVVAAGTAGRDSIRPLTNRDISFLTELESIRLGPFLWQKGIARRAISGEFHVVVLGPATLSLTTWAILVGRRLARRKTYLWGQCGRSGERTVKRYIQEVMNRLAHGLLVYGEAESAAAISLGTSPAKVHVVNNATHDNDRFISDELGKEAYRRMQDHVRRALNNEHIVLTYVGRLTEGKHLPVLFDAARELQRQYRNLQVRVVGGGEMEHRLRSEYNDQLVDFRGWIYDNATLNDLLQESTLVVSPCHMGLLAVDALRVGVPVLVPDNPRNGSEVESLTESVNSLKFVPGDRAALVDAVNRWLRIAPGITESDFVNARDAALRTWSPGSVASKILDTINRAP